MMNIDIKKGSYNKTVCVDGVHHEVDTEHEYTYYSVQINGVYTDVNNKVELINKIQADLKDMINNLEVQKQKQKQEKEQEER